MFTFMPATVIKVISIVDVISIVVFITTITSMSFSAMTDRQRDELGQRVSAEI